MNIKELIKKRREKKERDKLERRRDEVNIKYCDILLQNFQFDGRFTHQNLRSRNGPVKITDEEIKAYSGLGQDWFPTLTGFIIQNGYFFDTESLMPEAKEYVMTKRGNLAKELGGHREYQKFRKTELNTPKYQRRVNAGLILATSLAAVMPFVAERCGLKAPEKPYHNDTVYFEYRPALVPLYKESTQGTSAQKRTHKRTKALSTQGKETP